MIENYVNGCVGDGTDYGIITAKALSFIKKELSSVPGKMRKNSQLAQKMMDDPSNRTELQKRFAEVAGYATGAGIDLYNKIRDLLSDDWGCLSENGQNFVELRLMAAMTGKYICDAVSDAAPKEEPVYVHKAPFMHQ